MKVVIAPLTEEYLPSLFLIFALLCISGGTGSASSKKPLVVKYPPPLFEQKHHLF